MKHHETYPLIRGLMVDEGSRDLTLSVVAILDPSPHYPDVARVIVGSTAASEAQLSFHGAPSAIRKLAETMLQAADAAERAARGEDKNAAGTCGMIFPRHPDDERRPRADDPCMRPAIGTTEDGARVCEECAAGMVREGFRVDRDTEHEPC